MTHPTFTRDWPDFDGSLWASTAVPGPSFEMLEGERHVQVAVIGGGYCGLSTALELAKNNVSCAVLEARRIGFGGSGRNNGHCVPEWLWQSPDEIEEMFGEPQGRRMNEMASEAADLVFSLIREHDIDCEAVQSGMLKVTRYETSMAKLKKVAGIWQGRGKPVRALSAGELGGYLDAPGFLGGIIFEEGGHLNPLGYCRGLGRAAAEAGAEVFEHSPVLSITREGAQWRLTSASGSLTADAVVMATNAFPTGLSPEIDRSYVSVRALGLATDPIPEEVRKTLLPQNNNVEEFSPSDWRTLFFFFDGGGRLSTGSYLGLTVNDTLERATHSAGRHFTKIFPSLGEIKFTYHWEGRWEVTPNRIVGVHQLGPNFWGAVGFSGRGIPTATTVGRELGRMLVADDPGAMRLPVTGVPRARFPKASSAAWHNVVLPVAYKIAN